MTHKTLKFDELLRVLAKARCPFCLRSTVKVMAIRLHDMDSPDEAVLYEARDGIARKVFSTDRDGRPIAACASCFQVFEPERAGLPVKGW